MRTRAHDATEHAGRLEEGRAFADLSGLRKVLVSGGGPGAWLNDLVTAGVEGLGVCEARRSLLLTPTGRIRAEFHVVRTGEGFLLLQDARQPRAIDALLDPYVLSSDVSIADLSPGLAVLAVLGSAPDGIGQPFRPSPLEEGLGLLVPAERHATAVRTLEAAGLAQVGSESLETRRVRSGRARFPDDLDEDSIPAEAGLERLIDFAKGCFLGQESVAKVRNLGRPPRTVLPLRADAPVGVGARIVAGGREVGRVTSVAPDGSALLGAVRWEDRHGPLATAEGVALQRE